MLMWENKEVIIAMMSAINGSASYASTGQEHQGNQYHEGGWDIWS